MASALSFVRVGRYVLIHRVEGEFAAPTVRSRRFNPVAVILSLVFRYWMWGVLGAILAMPILAIPRSSATTCAR